MEILKDFALTPFLFLIHINDLSDGLKSIYKIFADMSLPSRVKNLDTCNIAINKSLIKTSQSASQWKMLFNPDINEQAVEKKIFSKV